MAPYGEVQRTTHTIEEYNNRINWKPSVYGIRYLWFILRKEGERKKNPIKQTSKKMAITKLKKKNKTKTLQHFVYI